MNRFFYVILVMLCFFMFTGCENKVQSVTDSDTQAADKDTVNDGDGVSDTDTTADTDEAEDMDAGSDSDEVPGEDEDSVTPDDPPSGCADSSECGAGKFCDKGAMRCSETGSCRQIPEGCEDIYAPVCGCDGVVYPNMCEANRNARNAAYPMPCVQICETATLWLAYEWKISGEKKDGEGVLFFTGGDVEMFQSLSTPTQKQSGNISLVTVSYSDGKGIMIDLSFEFQREPFVLPQDINFSKSGGSTAIVKLENGTILGYLTGKITVEEYKLIIGGGFEKLQFNSDNLIFKQ